MKALRDELWRLWRCQQKQQPAPLAVMLAAAAGLLVLCLTSAIALTLPTCAAAEPLLAHAGVFVSGQEGYHTYRIPALEVAPDGALIAFAELRFPSRAGTGQQRQRFAQFLVGEPLQSAGRTRPQRHAPSAE